MVGGGGRWWGVVEASAPGREGADLDVGVNLADDLEGVEISQQREIEARCNLRDLRRVEREQVRGPIEQSPSEARVVPVISMHSGSHHHAIRQWGLLEQSPSGPYVGLALSCSLHEQHACMSCRPELLLYAIA